MPVEEFLLGRWTPRENCRNSIPAVVFRLHHRHVPSALGCCCGSGGTDVDPSALKTMEMSLLQDYRRW